MKPIDVKRFAKPALLAATLIWGTSFIIVKEVTNTLPVYWLITLRFIAASILLSLIFRRRFRNFSLEYLKRGGILGLLLFGAYTFQTHGITDTTPGKNAFLTAVYCIIVPFMAWVFNKKRPNRYNVIAAFVCIIGIGLVSLNADFTVRTGDLLTLCGGVFYALHIIAVSRYSDGFDPVLLTVFQFASTGLTAFFAALIFNSGTIGSVIWDPAMIFSISYLAVFCTAAALLFQNFGQKYTDPSSASLLLSLESVFGVAFSVILGSELLSMKLVFGFSLIFIAVVISETKLSFLLKYKNKEIL